MDGKYEPHEFPTQPNINITSPFATPGHPDSAVDYFEGFRKLTTLPFLRP